MEKFKVRIEKANPNNWYAHMIGETIEVIDHNTVQYYAVNETGLILKSDCTIIDPIPEKVEVPKVGEVWECVKDVIMDDGSIKFIEGRVYKCEADRCLTNETGNKYHGVFALEDDMDDDPNFITDHFRKIEPALTAPVDVQEVERLVSDKITEIDKMKSECLEAYGSAKGTEGDGTAGLNFGLSIARKMLIDIQDKIKGHTAAQQPSQWEKALVGLTPGGSEFAGDPERCVEYVKEMHNGMKEHILNLNKGIEQQHSPQWVENAVVGYNIKVTELLLHPHFNLEHSQHGKACEMLSELRNKYLSEITKPAPPISKP